MASTKCFLFFSTILTVSFWHMVQCYKETCLFNKGCWCYTEGYYLLAICSGFSTFPTFAKMPNGTSYVVSKLSVSGTFTQIPSYAFANLSLDSIELIREGNVTAPLSVDPYAFVSSSNKSTPLTELAFENFRGLTFVPTSALSRVSINTTLSFINSTFTTIDDQSFDGVSVPRLVLTGCGIITITDNAFAGMSLYYLVLSYNQLTTIPTAVTTVPLITLSLDNNKISNIQDNAFCSGSSKVKCGLTQLNLNNNPIGDNFAANAFANLQQLNVLYMPNVGMTKIPTTAIKPLAKSLSSFDVSLNKITKISNGTFNGFISLSENLVLPFNPIELIEPGAFNGMNETVLTIQSLPKLKTIDAAVTHGIKGIRTLYVADCPELTEFTMHNMNLLDVYLSTLEFWAGDNLHVVDPNVGKWLKQYNYKTLDISNNQIRCDSSINWMAEFVLCYYPQISIRNTACLQSGQSLFDYLRSTSYTCPGDNGSVSGFKVSNSYFVIFFIIATRLVSWF